LLDTVGGAAAVVGDSSGPLVAWKMKTIVSTTSDEMKIARQRPPPRGPLEALLRLRSARSAPRRSRRASAGPSLPCRGGELPTCFPISCRSPLLPRGFPGFVTWAASPALDRPTGRSPAADRCAEPVSGSPAGSGSGACRTGRRDVVRSSVRHPDVRRARDCVGFDCASFDCVPGAEGVDLPAVDSRAAAALIDGEPWSSHKADGPTGGDGVRCPRR
jgi:hypothetical protein